MATTLRFENFNEVNIKEKTQLNADAAAAATTVAVQNADGIVADDFAFIGRLGAESTEKRQVTGVSGGNLTVAAITNAHRRFEDLTIVRGDQVKIYRAANVSGAIPADGDFSILATVTIEADQLFTEYVDSTGGGGYWYKFTYYNSDSTDETDIADSEANRGDDFGHYVTVQEVREEAGMLEVDGLVDQTIAEKRNAAESRINGTLFNHYTLPFDEPIPDLIRQITRMLAAGWLIQMEYGPQAPDTMKDGKIKVDEAERLLKQIGERKLVITDYQGNSLLNSTGGVTGWPDETTEDALPEDAGGQVRFRISDKH